MEEGKGLNEERRPAMKQPGRVLEQRGRVLEQRGLALEQRGRVLEQRGLALEQRGTAMKQRWRAVGQRDRGIEVPEGVERVLLHACCAPCSSAIVEWLLAAGIRPTIYYCNPNIYPRQEYEIRKAESKRHAEGLGIEWIDDDWNHDGWLECVRGLEGAPERGGRCARCFEMRLTAAARKAVELGIGVFTTTLASSRWKRLDQIEAAGRAAEAAVEGARFWAQNWRKGGLQERRNELLKEYGFYNQQYCGCEFSNRG